MIACLFTQDSEQPPPTNRFRYTRLPIKYQTTLFAGRISSLSSTEATGISRCGLLAWASILAPQRSRSAHFSPLTLSYAFMLTRIFSWSSHQSKKTKTTTEREGCLFPNGLSTATVYPRGQSALTPWGTQATKEWRSASSLALRPVYKRCWHSP
jgi:hypothetical protein